MASNEQVDRLILAIEGLMHVMGQVYHIEDVDPSPSIKGHWPVDEICTALEIARRIRGYSQREVAAMMGYSKYQSYSRIEQGESSLKLVFDALDRMGYDAKVVIEKRR